MFSVSEIPFDQLPPALQALFSTPSKVFASLAATDSSEPAKTEHKPAISEQTASVPVLPDPPALVVVDMTTQPVSCADTISAAGEIEVHELAIESIDLDRFALDLGEW